jgi:predicted permease
MLRDIRLAIRRFSHKPGYTAAMVLVVGVGIGAVTAVFSVVDQIILRRPPFAHANRLVEVMDLYRSAGARSTNLTPGKIAAWQEQHALFEAVEAYAGAQFDLRTGDGEPERLRGLIVTTGLIQMLGVQPAIGRGFGDGDGRSGGDRVVLIGESLWQRRFAGRPAAVGSEIVLNDQTHTIVGVMPRLFRLTGDDEQVWVPVNVRASGANAPPRFVGLGRLAPGLAPGSEQALADSLAVRMQSETPLAREPFWDIALAPKRVATVIQSTRTALFVLLGAVVFVLLITCANTASLLLSQVGQRQREAAVRAAIGASRGRLFREVLVESVLLAAFGGVLGLLIATWGVDAIVAAAPPNLTFNATRPIEVDGRIVGIAAAMTLLTGMLFGLVPAIRGSAPNVDIILKSGPGHEPGSAAHGRLSSALVVAEVAFSLVLLAGAALMVRTFANLHSLDPGFDPDGTVAVHISLPTDRYVGEGARSAFFDAVRERLLAVPGVLDVATAAGPFGGAGIYFGSVEELEGREAAAPGGRIEVPLNRVTPEYFRTLGIPLLAGRTFSTADDAGAVVMSRALADRLWPAGDAVGRRFRLDASHPWETVVGVAGDLQPRAGDHPSAFHIYRRFAPPSAAAAIPPRTRGYSGRVVLVRAANPAAIVPAVRAAVWSLDPNQPIGRTALLADLYADSFARERFVLQLMAIFGAIALALTAAGIFGVLSQVVGRRTREIGVRVALGARAGDIARLVLGRTGLLLVLGTFIGLLAAALLSRFLEALLFEVRPIDPLSLAIVTLLLTGIALAASWLPTRRALRVDPAAALRVE